MCQRRQGHNWPSGGHLVKVRISQLGEFEDGSNEAVIRYDIN